MEQYKKPYKKFDGEHKKFDDGHKNNGYKKPFKKKEWKPKQEEKFDIEKWIKQHQNIEYPKRGKKNTIDKDRRKR